MSFEAIDMILKLWSGNPPYEFEGKYWTIRLKKTVDEETGIGYIHKPYQKPHPPIAIPGMSRDSHSMKYAGRMGFSPFAHCLIPGNVVADLWKTYEKAAREADRPAAPLQVPQSPARSSWPTRPREAKERARTNSLGKNYQYIGRLFDKGLGRRIYKRDPNMSDADCNLDYLMTEQIIAGDVDEVLRRLLLMVEETGPFGTLVMMSYDWDDKEAWLRSMELFQNELMPALNKALCGAVSQDAWRFNNGEARSVPRKDAPWRSLFRHGDHVHRSGDQRVAGGRSRFRLDRRGAQRPFAGDDPTPPDGRQGNGDVPRGPRRLE